MKFALINNEKREAIKGAKGICPICRLELVAKCGDIKINHWAHKGNRNCDPWWENETEWHRSWKGKFPEKWQEIIQEGENGEKHIADVKTKEGWVLEFQHSYLKPDERHARNVFYNKIVWVVDGLRRKTDKKQFQTVLKESRVELKEPMIRRVNFPDECILLKEWHNNNALVFFDFKEPFLWFLFPKTSNSEVYLATFLRDEFIKKINNNEFDDFVKNIIEPINDLLVYNTHNKREEINWPPIKHQKRGRF